MPKLLIVKRQTFNDYHICTLWYLLKDVVFIEKDIFKVREYKKYKNVTFKKDCVICGRNFKVPNMAPFIENSTTCCDYCTGLGISWKKMKGTYKQCSTCDKPIWVMPNKSKKSTRVYCNKECADMGTSIYSHERNLPAVKSGKKYYGDNWISQKKRARKRDSYKCRKCGVKEEDYGMRLSVHHIEPFVYFESYKDANSLSNLISVCEPCHRKIHSGKLHPYKFDSERFLFKTEVGELRKKHQNVAKEVVNLLTTTKKTLVEISKETGLSYSGVTRIYKGERWKELYDSPPKETNPRNKAKKKR